MLIKHEVRIWLHIQKLNVKQNLQWKKCFSIDAIPSIDFFFFLVEHIFASWLINMMKFGYCSNMNIAISFSVFRSIHSSIENIIKPSSLMTLIT